MTYTLNQIIDNSESFLVFLKSRTCLFHQSNVFFRDFHYGIIAYGESKRKYISYGNGEQLANQLVSMLEREAILIQIKPGSWRLNYPDFRKPSTKNEAATKPGSGPAVAKNAIATPSSGLAAPPSGPSTTTPVSVA